MKNGTTPLNFFYHSCMSDQTVTSIGGGNELAAIMEILFTRYAFIFTLYNNIVNTYLTINQTKNFLELKEGITLIVKYLENILVKLAKLQHTKGDIFVSRLNPRPNSTLPSSPWFPSCSRRPWTSSRTSSSSCSPTL